MDFDYVDWGNDSPPRIVEGDIITVDGRKCKVTKTWREEDGITVSFTLEAIDPPMLAPYTVVP